MIRRTLIMASAVLASFTVGCTDSVENGAGSLGESIGKNVTEFAQGVGTGVDNQLEIKVELSEPLKSAGLDVTVAKQHASLDTPDKSISVYLIASQAIETSLVAKAFNSEDQEVGRAIMDVAFGADDAKYVRFDFPAEMDRQTVVVYRVAEKKAE